MANSSFDCPIDEEEVNELECLFNWNVISLSKTQAFYNDRIRVAQHGVRNDVARYCLLGYLHSKAYEHDYCDGDGEISFQTALSLDYLAGNTDWLGYKAVVLGNLIYHFYKKKDYDKVQEYLIEYNEIKNDPKYYPLHDNPEVLAIKAFALSSVWKHEEAMEIYESILKDERYRDNPEWILGLAYAKEFHLAGRDVLKTDNHEIQILIRRVLEIDPSYHQARLRLAKHIKKTQVGYLHAVEEIKYLLDEVLDDKDAPFPVHEEAVEILCQIPQYYAEGLALLKEHYKKPNATKTIRCLAMYYLNLGKRLHHKKRKWQDPETGEEFTCKEAFLKCIEYYEQNTDLRHFDKTRMASAFAYLKNIDACNRENYVKQLEGIYKNDLLKHCGKELLKNQIQIYYYYGKHLLSIKQYSEACKYFKDLVRMAAKGSKEEVFGEVKNVKEAENELLNFATNYKYFNFLSEIEAFELKSWVQLKRKNFGSAIFYLTKALEKCHAEGRSTDILRMEENLASYYLERSKKNLEVPYMNHISCENMFKDVVQKLENLPDTSSKKWEIQCELYEIRVSKVMDAYKRLDDLKTLRMEFEKKHCETMKKLKHKKEKIDESQYSKLVVGIICEAKRILDNSLNFVKKEVYKKDPLTDNKKCYFKKFPEKTPKNAMEGKVRDRLENKFGLDQFSTKLPGLFKFLVENQHPQAVPWLPDTSKLRNANEHIGTEVENLLKNSFPTIENQCEVVRQCTAYAAQVWIVTKREVKTYLDKTSGASTK